MGKRNVVAERAPAGEHRGFRLLIPAAITKFENFRRRKHPAFSSQPVKCLSAGSVASDLSWIFKIRLGKKSGEILTFRLAIDGVRVKMRLLAESSVSIRSPSGAILYKGKTYRERLKERNSAELKCGTLDTASMKDSWLFDGTLYLCADVVYWPEDLPETEPGSAFLSALESELEGPVYSDFVLVSSDGVQIKTHKIILGSASPVFRAMFATDCEETRNGLCTIQDADEQAIRGLLRFIIGGSVGHLRWDVQYLQKVCSLADKYQILPVRQLCMEWLRNRINKESVLDILSFADQHSALQLKHHAFIFLEDKLKAEAIAAKLTGAAENGGQMFYEEWRAHAHLRKTGVPLGSGSSSQEQHSSQPDCVLYR